MRSLIGLGVSGGIVPCPSALVVLIAAISQHRVGLGMVLIFAFSLGLAATLTAVGLAVIWGGRALAAPAPRAPDVRRSPRRGPAGRLGDASIVLAGHSDHAPSDPQLGG